MPSNGYTRSTRTVDQPAQLAQLAVHRLQIQPLRAVEAVVKLVPRVDDDFPVHPLRPVVRSGDVVVPTARRRELAPQQERLHAELPRLERERGVKRGPRLGGEHHAARRERVQGEERILVHGRRPHLDARFRLLFRVSLARASRTHARCEAKRAVARAPSPDVVATRLSLGRRAEPMKQRHCRA